MTKIQKMMSIGGISFFALLLTSSTSFAANPIGNVSATTGYAADVGSLITSVLSIVLVIALLLVLLYLIWGGITWITAGGDKGKTEEARNKITAAVIGIIILAAAWALINLVAYFLGFDNLQGGLENIVQINSTGSGNVEDTVYDGLE